MIDESEVPLLAASWVPFIVSAAAFFTAIMTTRRVARLSNLPDASWVFLRLRRANGPLLIGIGLLTVGIFLARLGVVTDQIWLLVLAAVTMCASLPTAAVVLKRITAPLH